VTPAVFLDRDGTMIHEAGYLSRREDLRWFPWTVDAIRALNHAGYLVFVVTNQGGIGLGYYPEQFVIDTHRHMDEWLVKNGARIDGWFYCPHHPEAIDEALRADCICRKPGVGMVKAAEAAAPIDFARSFVIGDRLKDVELASAIGAKGILVRTGYGENELVREAGHIAASASFVAADLMEATSWILRVA
jgi:D-glycero-D-manno-heptose 1,7-bisphosphate phosphatase